MYNYKYKLYTGKIYVNISKHFKYIKYMYKYKFALYISKIYGLNYQFNNCIFVI